MSEEHLKPFTLVPLLPPLSPCDCILTLLSQQAPEHTHMHKCTQINTKHLVDTKQVFMLVYSLCVFAPVCLRVGVCVCVCTWYFLFWAGYRPRTSLPLTFHLFLFPSLTLLIFPSIFCKPQKTSTTFPPDSSVQFTKCYIHTQLVAIDPHFYLHQPILKVPVVSFYNIFDHFFISMYIHS